MFFNQFRAEMTLPDGISELGRPLIAIQASCFARRFREDDEDVVAISSKCFITTCFNLMQDRCRLALIRGLRPLQKWH